MREGDLAGLLRAAGAVFDAVLLRQGLGAGVEPAGQGMGLGVRGKGRGERAHELCGRAPPFPAFGHQLLHGREELVRVVPRLLFAVLDELPVLCLVEFELQLQVRDLATCHVQRGGFSDARGLPQHHRPVRTAHEAVCAGDHVEGVVGFLLARVVHDQNRDIEAVGDTLERGHDLVVPAVAVTLRLHLADALQRVDDHEADAGVLAEKACKLLLKALAEKLGLCGDPDALRLPARHFAQPLLDALGRVLETDVQDFALRGFEAPYLLALADPVGQPQNEPTFADLACPGEDIDAFAKQLLDQPACGLELHVHQGVGVDGVQLADALTQRALDVADGLELRHARVLQQDVVQQVALMAAVHA